MTHVYIVQDYTDMSNPYIIAVYSTFELAEKLANSNNNYYFTMYKVDEIT